MRIYWGAKHLPKETDSWEDSEDEGEEDEEEDKRMKMVKTYELAATITTTKSDLAMSLLSAQLFSVCCCLSF